MDFVGKTFNMPAFINKKEEPKTSKTNKTDNNTKQEETKSNTSDKLILGSLAAFVGLTVASKGMNIFGKITGKGKLGTEFFSNAFNKIKKSLNLEENFKKLTEPVFNKIRNSEKTTNWLSKQAVNDRWLERGIVANLVMRTGIGVSTGMNPYTLINVVMNEVLNLGLLGAADKTIIKPATRSIAKLLKVPAHNSGVKVITEQGIKNVGLICVLMGFLNTAVSGRIFKFINSFSKNNEANEAKNIATNINSLHNIKSNNYWQRTIKQHQKQIFADFLKIKA